MWILDLLRQQDRAGASAECRLAVNEIAELLKSFFAEQLQKRARLTAGNHQPIDLVQLLRLAHQYDLGAEFFHPPPMRVKVALKSKDTDFRNAIHHSLFATGNLSAIKPSVKTPKV